MLLTIFSGNPNPKCRHLLNTLWSLKKCPTFCKRHFRYISMTKEHHVLIQAWLKYVPICPNDNMSASVHVMAWRGKATSHYMNQCRLRSTTLCGVTRHQWVNSMVGHGMRSMQSFAQNTTSRLPWHAQNAAAIVMLQSGWQQNEIRIEVFLRVQIIPPRRLREGPIRHFEDVFNINICHPISDKNSDKKMASIWWHSLGVEINNSRGICYSAAQCHALAWWGTKFLQTSVLQISTWTLFTHTRV